jgi:hypothetical protein
MVLMDILGGRIGNGRVAQYIHATASVDYTAWVSPDEHQRVWQVMDTTDQGVGVNVWITSPCEAGVNQSCIVSLNAPERGTLQPS